MRRTDDAIVEYQRALDINPNFAAAHGHLGSALAFDGQSDKAIPHLELALQMSPHDPQNFRVYTALSAAHYMTGSFAEAVGFGRNAVKQRPGFSGGHRIYVACLAQAGQIEEARKALDRLKELQPEISVAWIEQNAPWTALPMAKYVEGMRKAGLQ